MYTVQGVPNKTFGKWGFGTKGPIFVYFYNQGIIRMPSITAKFFFCDNMYIMHLLLIAEIV